MENHSKETLGEYLKKKREARNISREELSQATRMGIPFLQALEEDDFDFFPQKDFIRGFLRIYARQLELNEPEILRRYSIQEARNREQKSFQQLPLFRDHPSPIEKVSGPQKISKKKRRRIPILVAIIIISLGLSLYLHYQLSRSRDTAHSFSPMDWVATIWPKKSPLETVAVVEEKKAPLPAAPVPPVEPPPVEPAQPTVVEPPPQEKVPPPKKIKVFGNRDSKRYHLPGMKYYDKVAAYHRVEFESEEAAIKAGYHKAAR